MATWTNVLARRDFYRRRYKNRREELLHELGDKCASCGSTNDLEFDHKDPTNKVYDFDYLFMLGKDNIVLKEEISKLQLLCSRCHTNKTRLEQSKQVCKNGHIRSPENTNSSRACKLCARMYAREYKRKRKSLV